jgi:hypothetical protein
VPALPPLPVPPPVPPPQPFRDNPAAAPMTAANDNHFAPKFFMKLLR